MNLSRRAAATTAALIVLGLLAFIAFRYFEARKSFYYHDGELIGKAALLTCFSRSPIFLYGGMPSETDIPEPLFAQLEVELSCRAIKTHGPALVEDRSGPYRTNRTFYELTELPYCSHPSFSQAMFDRCEDGRNESLRWLIDEGVDLDTPKTCGYLRSAVLRMDEYLFNFLLENGADPFSVCPPYDPDDSSQEEHKQETVGDVLESLLAGYTASERATIVAPMTRMLETIRREREDSIASSQASGLIPELCTPPGLDFVRWVLEYFEEADIVLLATVKAVHEHPVLIPPDEDPKESRSMKELVERIAADNRSGNTRRSKTQTISLDVNRSWKGEPGSSIDVIADKLASDIGNASLFQLGKTYLVFGFGEHAFVPGRCAIDTDEEDTAYMMRVLDVVVHPPSIAR